MLPKEAGRSTEFRAAKAARAAERASSAETTGVESRSLKPREQGTGARPAARRPDFGSQDARIPAGLGNRGDRAFRRKAAFGTKPASVQGPLSAQGRARPKDASRGPDLRGVTCVAPATDHGRDAQVLQAEAAVVLSEASGIDRFRGRSPAECVRSQVVPAALIVACVPQALHDLSLVHESHSVTLTSTEMDRPRFGLSIEPQIEPGIRFAPRPPAGTSRPARSGDREFRPRSPGRFGLRVRLPGADPSIARTIRGDDSNRIPTRTVHPAASESLVRGPSGRKPARARSGRQKLRSAPKNGARPLVQTC